jgi:hypothetical protein
VFIRPTFWVKLLIVLPPIAINKTEFVESVDAYNMLVVRVPVEIDEAYMAIELKLEFRPAATAAIPVESVDNPVSITKYDVEKED